MGISPENKAKRQLKNANENIESYKTSYADYDYSYNFDYSTPYYLILTCHTHQTRKARQLAEDAKNGIKRRKRSPNKKKP